MMQVEDFERIFYDSVKTVLPAPGKKDDYFIPGGIFIKSREAALIMGISARSLKNLCKAGKIEFTKPGGLYLFNLDVLRRHFVNENYKNILQKSIT